MTMLEIDSLGSQKRVRQAPHLKKKIRRPLHAEIQLVKIKTLHPDSFSDHLHCSDYYYSLYPLLCLTAQIDRTGSDLANEEATISCLFSVTSNTLCTALRIVGVALQWKRAYVLS
jgi:hypothetical protein